MGNGNKITLPEYIPPVELCKTSKHLICLNLPGIWRVTMHRECIHNEIRSLKGRVLKQTPEPNKQALVTLKWYTDQLVRRVGSATMYTREELISSFPQGKQKSYKKVDGLKLGYRQLLRDTAVNAFIKSERLVLDENPDPRMIQFRSMNSNLHLGQFTKPVEKKLYQMKWDGQRLIAKGLNLHARANLLHKMWSKYKNPNFLSLDLSRWDMHNSQDMIKILHKFYLGMIPDPFFRQMLKMQLVNKGFTKNQIRYTKIGGVMSGDMTTALGNCVLVVLMMSLLKAIIQEHGIPSELTEEHLKIQNYHQVCTEDWTMLDDGDDHIIIGEAEILEKLAKILPQYYLMMGHELKVEAQGDQFEQVQFCQHKPMKIRGMYVMIPNPRKVLATSLSYPAGINPWDYLPIVWEARAILHQGVPVLGPVFLKLATKYPVQKRDTTFQINLQVRPWMKPHKSLPNSIKDITSDVEVDARQQFNWDVSIDEQKFFEDLDIAMPNNIREVSYDFAGPIGKHGHPTLVELLE